jgi:hypothetical protein
MMSSERCSDSVARFVETAWPAIWIGRRSSCRATFGRP